VAAALRNGVGGKKVFVSTLFAQRWLDIEDVQPEDLVLQIARQLVADLQDSGMTTGEQRFASFVESLMGRLASTSLAGAEVGINPLKLSFKLTDFPSARQEFREILRGQLPTAFDLVNNELLPAARAHLAEVGGFDDILLIVDDLDKMPQKILSYSRVSNHENLFLDNAATLRAVNCSMLMTIPIELAYSPAQGRLRDDYGASIATIPLVSVRDRAGHPVPSGEQALAEVIGRRARRAFGNDQAHPLGCASQIFESPELLRRVVQLCGGHVRSLLVMLTELLDWVDDLPIPSAAVSRYVPRAAKDLARGLLVSDRQVLAEVEGSKEAPEHPRFFDLLRNHYVFAYEAGLDDYWYGLNPLLREIEL
jgi:hypothetical protein